MNVFLTTLPETITERVVAVAGVVAAIALVLFAFAGRTDRSAVPVAAPAAADPAPATGVTPPTSLPAAKPRPAARPAAARTILVVAATRGECWLSIRKGSADGETLYEGVLSTGRSVRLTGATLWVRLGAAANVDLTINGKKAAALPAGTVDAVASPAGVRPA